MSDRTCLIDGCARPHYARGWCNLHWNRWRAHGDPTICLVPRSREDRFWEKVDRQGPNDCWLWTAAKAHLGYGQFDKQGAHRVAYELLRGPIPDDLELDHLCRTPACVNPAHLEPVTHAENMRRSRGSGFELNAAKTHCPQGHAYEEHGVVEATTGRRRCRLCHRKQCREYMLRKRSIL